MKPGIASSTALTVAAGLQLVHRDARYQHLVPEAAARLGAALLTVVHPRLAGFLEHGWFRTMCCWLERATLPGILLHYALRKQMVRNLAHASIAAGCRQVVVLGAGLDSLCMELLTTDPGICCIEIDHPATQPAKVRGLAASQLRDSINFVSADLGCIDLRDALAECPAYRADEKTLFVAESLLMYLPSSAVERLLGQIAAAAVDSRFAFTWFEPGPDGQPDFSPRSRLVALWLRMRGEPFLSGLARQALPEFLELHGFAMLSVADSMEAMGPAGCMTIPPRLHPICGEYICLAEKGMKKPAGDFLRDR